MNIRKRKKSHTEVHTGALNDILFILLLFFLIVSTLANPNVVKVNNPKGQKDTKAKQNIVISIDKDQKVYMGQTEVPREMLDSLLKMEVTKYTTNIDTPSVVINADSIAFYGEVFRIMRVAKKSGAKVVANVQ
ncbi:outer membrane transport energization protein ExbD [Filimonas lacunae]|uniref:Outer membrane transport energization protein ExbD n=1 Tax=Filimonas lacunae TaxID=477680 RepID=A0A173ML93_9BACT|nr:biopolymer transporter ExbD [Filimonas lacunae]BAV08403.1 biopolymer transport protein ExbD/TolR [Filimonas lacunae]SIT33515.1 outer membrane transport energization protein ExbD [Filimonas lacunae]